MEGSKTLFYSSKFQSFFEICRQLVRTLSKRLPSPGLLLLSSYVNKVDLVRMKFIANKHTPLPSSPHPVGPSASCANYSNGRTTMHCSVRISDTHFCYVGKIASQFDLDFRNISWTEVTCAIE